MRPRPATLAASGSAVLCAATGLAGGAAAGTLRQVVWLKWVGQVWVGRGELIVIVRGGHDWTEVRLAHVAVAFALWPVARAARWLGGRPLLGVVRRYVRRSRRRLRRAARGEVC